MPPEVLLACARPADVPHRDWDELAHLLDHDERDRAQRLRFDADRQAFVLAHALLRALVCAETGHFRDTVRIARDVKGRPFVASSPGLHVSLSRTRDAVACAATRAGPVGVDVERVDSKPVDAGVLGTFVVTQETLTAQRFFHEWTALEAFWKACGTGLTDGQARIRCVPRAGSRFDVYLEHGTGGCAGRGALVHAFPDCALAVALRAPIEPHFVVKRTHCAGAPDIRHLAAARLHAGRFSVA